jgi:hypothetical protein
MAKIQEYLSLSRPIRYVTKDDLMFQGLAPSSGREMVRLRFSRPSGAELEIPLQAESLKHLVQAVGALHDTPIQDLAAAVDELGRHTQFLHD